VSVSGSRICRLAEQASAAQTPDAALTIVKALRAEIDEFERQHVARALTLGESVSAVAHALGVSRQSAHRRFRDLVPPRARSLRPRPSPETRIAVEYARRQACEHGAAAVGSEHILLGILRSGASETVEALNAQGVTIESAGPAAQAVTATRRGRPELEDEAKAVVVGALRAADREGAAQIGLEHLLAAALADPAGGAAEVMRALGVSPDARVDQPA
jgi:ATP-dependent Clp protease ATP-binding subunit ClpA